MQFGYPLEIWTYHECGCSFQRAKPCYPRKHRSILLSGGYKAPVTFTPTQTQFVKPIQTQSQVTNSKHNPIDVDSHLDHHCKAELVQKHFLEPICDICTLKEHRQNMAVYADTHNGQGLIWGSTVEIEIDSLNSERNSIDSTGKRSSTSIDTESPSIVPNLTHRKRREQNEGQTPSPNSAAPDADADADDEGSLKGRSFQSSQPSQQFNDVRGRPRSNTKQLRRRAIDLSRDELRISSRWSSGEKRSMENFREAIRRKANGIDDEDPFLTWAWLQEKRRPIVEEAKAIKNKVVKSLQRSVSRGRSRRAQGGKCENGQSRANNTRYEQEQQRYDLAFKSSEQDQRLNLPRQVQENSRKPTSLSTHPLEFSTTTPRAYAADNVQDGWNAHENENRHASWLQHLEQDLQHTPTDDKKLRHKKGHYILRQPLQTSRVGTPYNRGQGKSLLPSNFFPDYHLRRSSSAGSLLQPSVESSCYTIQEYHRLPSLALSNQHESTNSSGNWILKEENLEDIIASDELKQEWYNNDNNGNGTSIASSSLVSAGQPSSHLSTLDLFHAAQRDLNRQFPEQKRLDSYSSPFASPSPSSSPLSTGVLRNAEERARRIDSGHACNWSLPHGYSGRLASSASVPDSLNSRLSSFRQNDDYEAMKSTLKKSRALALHPLTMQLPHENLVRPSIGANFRRWDQEDIGEQSFDDRDASPRFDIVPMWAVEEQINQ